MSQTYAFRELWRDILREIRAQSRAAVAPFTVGGKLDRGTPNAVGHVPPSGGGTGHDRGAEPPLGNPDTDGQLLSSTADGVRSWADLAALLAAALAATSLGDLGDVALAGVAEGDILAYRAGRWRNTRPEAAIAPDGTLTVGPELLTIGGEPLTIGA